MENRFKKVMSATDILVIAFGAMIGWGWVVSSGRWIQNAGVVGTVIAFIIGGVMIYFVGMTYAELTPAMPKVGGEHVFRGTVASGDQFVASEAFVRRLQEEFNAIACEMEGASIALVCEQYNTPFVVIRTLSDKADGLAHETYENMADLAADNSCRIVMEMLKSSKAIEKND